MVCSRFGLAGCTMLPLVFAVAVPGTLARADVLYDSRGMAVNGTWSYAKDSMIGGFADFGMMIDHQLADDFTVANPVSLTRVTADFWTPSESFAVPAGGWLVEVFADVGGKPSETASRTAHVAAALNVGSFAWTGGGGFFPPVTTAEHRNTYAIDLTGRGIALDAGTWWISVVAVDDSPFGGDYLWVGSRPVVNGSIVHARDGGIAHGNGYPGPDNIPFAWTAMTSANPSSDRPYELSMRIEGNVVPAPGLGVLFASIGLAAATRRRR